MSDSLHRTAASADPKAVATPGSFAQIIKFLGGRQVFKKSITSKLDVHEVIRKGLPGGVLIYMVKHIQTMKPVDVGQAVGVSIRTVQRRTGSPQKLLSQDQSGRAWKFAEVLTTATEVFGSQSEAEKWLTTPAVALDQRRPVDLLSSPAGVEMVEQLLGRLEYGVYT
jgi:putative toxin-antitoxin system antitoxin component (TIGR02293 family)